MQADVRAPNKRALKERIKKLQAAGAALEDKPAESVPDVACELNEAARAALESATTTPPPQDGAIPTPTPTTPQEAERFAPFVQLDLRAELPPFPLEALPCFARDWALGAAEAEQVPVDLAAALTLGTMAIATMGKAKVDMFGEPLNLWLALNDRSGANKSGIFARAMRPIHGGLAAGLEGHRLAVDDWQAERAMLEGSIKRLQRATSKSTKGEDATERELNQGDLREKLSDAIKALREHDDGPPRGNVKIASDVTPERIADFLAGFRCVAQVSDEGAEVFDGMGRYQAKGEKMEAYLKAWKGDRLIVDRKNGTQIDISDPTLTLITAAQPVVLERLRDPDGAREGKGLLGRFLWVVPKSRVGTRRLTRHRPLLESEPEYHREVHRLAALPYPEGEAPIVRCDDDAWALASDFYDETERQLRPGGALVDVEAFASKLRSYVARFAGILHLADGRPVTEAIGADTMGRAITLARYFLAHGRAAFGMMTTDEQAARALKLWPALQRLDGDKGEDVEGFRVVEARDLRARVSRSSFPDADTIAAALTTLEAHGYVRRVDVVLEGRKVKRIAINPEAR